MSEVLASCPPCRPAVTYPHGEYCPGGSPTFCESIQSPERFFWNQDSESVVGAKKLELGVVSIIEKPCKFVSCSLPTTFVNIPPPLCRAAKGAAPFGPSGPSHPALRKTKSSCCHQNLVVSGCAMNLKAMACQKFLRHPMSRMAFHWPAFTELLHDFGAIGKIVMPVFVVLQQNGESWRRLWTPIPRSCCRVRGECQGMRHQLRQSTLKPSYRRYCRVEVLTKFCDPT